MLKHSWCINATCLVQSIDAILCAMLQDRLAYGQVYGISPERKGSGVYLPLRSFPALTGGATRRRRGRISAAELAERNGEEPEEAYAGSRQATAWYLVLLRRPMIMLEPCI